MPLTEEQNTAVQAFAAALEGADAKDVAEALKGSAAPVYQAAFQAGHSTATAGGKGKTKELNDTIAALTTERDEAKAEAERLAQANPDHAAKIKSLEDALAASKDAVKAAKDEAAARVRAVHADKARADIVSGLIEKGVDPDYAREVLASKLSSRVRVGDATDDGTTPVEYLDADGLTPLTSGLDGMVQEAVASVDAKWLRSNADAGSGAKGSNGAPQNGRLAQLQAAGKSLYKGNGAVNSDAAKRRAERWAPNPQN